MERRRYLRAIGPALLLAIGGAYAVASWNWCGRWEVAPAAISGIGAAQGALRAGAARVAVKVPFPIVAAGYGPTRPEVSDARPDIEARAVVLEVSPVKVAIVELDLLLVPPALVDRVRADVASLGMSQVIVVATHAHSSMGGYDARLVSEIAGTGSYRQDAFDALVAAADQAVRSAHGALRPAVLRVGQADASALVRARSGSEVDTQFTRISMEPRESAEVEGVRAAPIAELWIVSAHATLVERKPAHLSPDYPGIVDSDEGPVTLVLQSAVGNASAVAPDGKEGTPESRFADALASLARGASGEAGPADTYLAYSRVTFGVPRPDSSRLAPWFARAAGDNLLCSSATPDAELSALRVNDLVFVAVPAEPSQAAAHAILQKTGASRMLSVADGYLGYVEPADVVKSGGGESKRQYFGADLLANMTDAAELAVHAVRPVRGGKDGGL